MTLLFPQNHLQLPKSHLFHYHHPELASFHRWIISISCRTPLQSSKPHLFHSHHPKLASFQGWITSISSQNHMQSPKLRLFHSHSPKFTHFHRWFTSLSSQNLRQPPKPHFFHSNSPKLSPFHKWMPPFSSENHLHSPKSHFCLSSSAKLTSFQSFSHPPQALVQTPRSSRSQAQAALLEYLHCTRCLHFIDAEQMSRNSPAFLQKLLRRLENGAEFKYSLSKFLQYHPINEFEPFFESLGLKELEISRILPHNSIFLCEDQKLVDNVHALCDYGVPRNCVGKMFMEKKEIFRYDEGVLSLKLAGLERLGLSKGSVLKLVVASPSLLIEDIKCEFRQLLMELKSLGIECNWISGNLSENSSYDWHRMLGVVRFLGKIGCSKEVLGGLIMRHPEFLLDTSGDTAYSLIALLLKLGFVMDEIVSVFMDFPRIRVGKFMRNLQQGLKFFNEIEMEVGEVARIVHSHLQVLGSSSLKSPNTVLVKLNVGKKRLCGIIKDDPSALRNWIVGSTISRLPKRIDDRRLMEKTAFLLGLGFVDGSAEMKNALKMFRGRSAELKERFDCFVKAGLDPIDVCNMIKAFPQVLNRSKDLIEKKIDFLVNSLQFPVESLLEFPNYMSYTTERVKLRFLMFEWLKDQGKASPVLAMSTILAYSDKKFTQYYVKRHPDGPKVWEKFKKELSLR